MKYALTVVLGFALAGAGPQDSKDAPKDAPKESPKEALQGAVKKTAALKSYAFKGDLEREKGNFQFKTDNDEEGAEEKLLENYSGKYDKSAGIVVKTNETEFATVEGQTVRRKSAEAWESAAKAFLRGHCPKAPHEFIGKVLSEAMGVRKKESKEKVGDVECTVFSFELSDEGANELFTESSSRNMPVMGNAETTSEGKVWVDAEGRIVKFKASAGRTMSLGGFEVNMGSVTWNGTLSELDSAKVEIPEKAKEALKKP